MSVEEYQKDRIGELGDFIGTVVAGIYQGILKGKVDNPSHFEQAAGRAHLCWREYFNNLK